MTVYTYRQNALDLLDRITNAPDTATHANLIDQLRDQFIENATVLQALAESNERWAKQNTQTQLSVESLIDSYYKDEEPISEIMKQLADLFDIELERDVEITVTVEYTVTATVDRSISDDEITEKLSIVDDLDFRLGIASNLDWRQESFEATI